MLVGHFAVGLAAKRIVPSVSAGTLILAAVLADLLAFVFLIAGIEHVNIRPGNTAVNPVDCYDFAISHSLLMDAIWAGLFAAAYFLWRRNSRGAWVLFAAVLSHWVLDFVSHRPDMALAPGVHRYFGLGLWNSLPATLLVEGSLWLLAVAIYARAAKPKLRFWIVVVLLSLVFVTSPSAPPPRSVMTFAIQGLIFFSLVVAWACWINPKKWTPNIAADGAP
jgi:hypothetical protein